MRVAMLVKSVASLKSKQCNTRHTQCNTRRTAAQQLCAKGVAVAVVGANPRGRVCVAGIITAPSGNGAVDGGVRPALVICVSIADLYVLARGIEDGRPGRTALSDEGHRQAGFVFRAVL